MIFYIFQIYDTVVYHDIVSLFDTMNLNTSPMERRSNQDRQQLFFISGNEMTNCLNQLTVIAFSLHVCSEINNVDGIGKNGSLFPFILATSPTEVSLVCIRCIASCIKICAEHLIYKNAIMAANHIVKTMNFI